MPPRVRITKEDILNKAVEVVQRSGEDALNARMLAKELECSTQPIFSNYATMEQLRHDVLLYANKFYESYVEEKMKSGKYPGYKASGIAYICFAREEKELFKLLYMRDRSNELISENEADNVAEALCEYLGLTLDAARLFHLESWMFVHGIAVTLASGFLSYDDEMISNMLTDVFEGLKYRFGVTK